MADILSTKRDPLADTHRVIDKMANLLERILGDEDIAGRLGIDIAAEINEVLDEAARVRYRRG